MKEPFIPKPKPINISKLLQANFKLRQRIVELQLLLAKHGIDYPKR